MPVGGLNGHGRRGRLQGLSWEEHFADVRGVRSITPDLPGVKRYSELFGPRKIGNPAGANSIKYAACSVCQAVHGGCRIALQV